MSSAPLTLQDARRKARVPFPAAELSEREQLRRAFPALSGWHPAPSAADLAAADARRLAQLERQRARDTADAAELRAHVAAWVSADRLARLDARRAELPDTPGRAADFWRAHYARVFAQDLHHGDEQRDWPEEDRL
jgi:hypothetical protein